MPRPEMKQEKSKDFTGSMKRLFNSLGSWKTILIISIILGFFSAALSAIAPNKLADLTDVVSDGIKPNVKKLEIVSEKIGNNIVKNLNINSKEINITKNTDNEQYKIMLKKFNSMSIEEKSNLLEDFEIDGIKISKNDQIEYLNIISTIDENTITNGLLKKLDKLPKSINKLVEPKMNVENLKKRSMILATIYLLSSILIYIESIMLAYMSNGYAKRLRTSISTKINKLPLKYFDNHETGDILSRVTNDVDTVGMNINQSISSLVTNLTLFIGSIIMMFVTNWIMALTAILSSILGFISSFFILKKSQKYFVKRQSELGEINGHIEEIYSGHNVVKVYNGEQEAIEKFDEINNRLYESNRKSQFLSGIMQPIMGFIGNFGYVAVCVVGALLVMNDKTSFGTIVAFMIYIRLFTRPLSQIAQALTALQSTAAAAERIFEFQDEIELSNEDSLTDEISKEDAKGNIEFKNVSFGYNKDKEIIKNFSAKIKSGQKIAIVGPTGAGKTTMVNLLMKFYEINKGDIIIDGKSIKNLTRENVHKLFCMVLQDTWLFDGTIRDNIKYNQEEVSDETIWDACRIVGIDHFIKTLPQSLSANINDSESISSGQKQLITIARGMIEDAPFLILDEATSNVDTRTEELVQKAMDKLTTGRTSFIIAHRLSTIKNADLILVMNEGNIIEQGNHNELLEKNGFYAKLYNSQFQR